MGFVKLIWTEPFWSEIFEYHSIWIQTTAVGRYLKVGVRYEFLWCMYALGIGHVHKYEAVSGYFVDIEIVAAFWSITFF